MSDSSYMGYLIIILLLTMFLCYIIFPRQIWSLGKSFRFKNPDVVEPSELTIWWLRASSALLATVCACLLIWAISQERVHAHCEEVLPELKERYAAGGFSSVERRAHDLGLEAKDYSHGLFSIVITKGDEPFATIWVNPLKAECDV